MNRTCTWMLYGVVALASTACLSPAESNDMFPVPDASTTPPVDAAIATPTLDGAIQSLPDAGSSDAGASDAGTDGGAADSAVAPVSLKGTGANCLTYTAKMGDKCYGKYCGVTAPMIDAALTKPRIGACPMVTAEDACGGLAITLTAKCARAIKTANPLDSNAQLRPKIQTCIYADPAGLDMVKVPPACVSCYIDSAECAGALETCLTQCLGGDSPDCDACREEKGCNDPVAACAGFPDPR